MLELHNITKTYDGRTVISNLTLRIQEHEWFTILGRSGSGKSTLLRLIAGVEASNGGRISLNGQCIDHCPPHKRPFHVIWQRLNLFPHMSVAENIAYSLRIKRWPQREIDTRVDWVVDRMQLRHVRNRMPQTLSGGEQQRTAIGRAVADPSVTVYLLDEPLSSLDAPLRKTMWDFLLELKAELRATFVYVTHDQQEALALSDRIAVLADGKLLQQDTPHNLYNRPASTAVAKFIGEVNLFQGCVEQRAELRAFITTEGLCFDLPDDNHDCSATAYAVRPEFLHIDSDSPRDRPIVLPGIVSKYGFLGPSIRYDVRLLEHDHLTVSATIPAKPDLPNHGLGTRVFVSWCSAAGILLKD